MKTLHTILRRLRGKVVGFFALFLVMGLSFALAPNVSQAQSLPAGTTIGNQASATYTDSNGTERTVTSNTVNTVVQQVASLTITQGITKTVNPGGTVNFPHTITNTGNGADTFTLATSDNAADFSFGSISIYEDANGDGVPDNLTSSITQTPSIAAGDVYSFVVVANVPSSAVAGDSDNLDVTATSQFNTGVSASTSTSSDVANVSETAVVDVLKSLSKNSGAVDDEITVTLTFTNSGNATATNLVLKDPLQLGFEYVPGSGKFSGTGTTPLTDDATADGANITYAYDASGSGGNGEIQATIDALTTGQQGTLTFKVKVNDDSGGQTIDNTANYKYDGFTTPQNTNTTKFTFNVSESFGVLKVDKLEGDYGTGYDFDTIDDDTVKVDMVDQGSTIDFVNAFQNTGSTYDRFNISLDTGTYPSGTTFTIYKSDGSGHATSPLVDSNGDGTPDIGPVAATDSVEVIVKVQLPENVSGDNSGAGYTVKVTATSIGDDTKTDYLVDKLNAITISTVDITNTNATPYTSSDGYGVFDGPDGEPTNDTYGESTAQVTNTVNPGKTTSITLYVTNTSNASDNYNLSVGTTGGSTYAAGNLPDGVTVQLKNDAGADVANTGSIAAGDNVKITATITVASNAAPGTDALYFRAQSSSTGATDIIHDAITVSSVNRITLAPVQNGQVAPGGSILYVHTLTNTGNTDQTVSSITLALANQTTAFQSLVYVDTDGDGAIDTSTDKLVDTDGTGSLSGLAPVTTLEPGGVINLIVKVTATSGVSDGTTNTTTLTATGNSTTTTKDYTTVVSGNLTIVKKQRIHNTGSFASTDLKADPGQEIDYQIVVSNNGAAAVTNVTVSDNTPPYTTLSTTPSATTPTGSSAPSVSDPGVNGTGKIKVSLGTLAAGQSFTVTFTVKING